MAKIKPGMIVTDIRGKLGGSNFQKGAQSLTIRNKPTATKSPSLAQRLVRKSIQAVNGAWRSLTPEEYSAWQAFAKTITFTSTMGKTYHPSARNAFIYVQQPFFTYLYNYFYIPPVPEPFDYADVQVHSLSVTSKQAQIFVGSVQNYWQLLFYCSKPGATSQSVENASVSFVFGRTSEIDWGSNYYTAFIQAVPELYTGGFVRIVAKMRNPITREIGYVYNTTIEID